MTVSVLVLVCSAALTVLAFPGPKSPSCHGDYKHWGWCVGWVGGWVVMVVVVWIFKMAIPVEFFLQNWNS